MYQNEEIVFVFTERGNQTWRWVGSGKFDNVNKKMIKGSTTTISANFPITATFVGLNDQLGTNWALTSNDQPDGEKMELVLYSAGGLLNGKGKDSFGDKWTSTGTLKDGKVHLVNTFPDGETMIFDGTLDAQKQIMVGYASEKGGISGSFAIKMN